MSCAAGFLQIPEGSEEEAHGSHQEAAQGGECSMYFYPELDCEILITRLFRSAWALSWTVYLS
jgi:hypothetical protein